MELLKKNPDYSGRELAESIGGITEDGIKYNLAKLKKEGRIKRIGPAKGGRWKVIEDGDSSWILDGIGRNKYL